MQSPPLSAQAILLAAGGSTRTLGSLGLPKGLILVGGQPFVLRQVSALFDAGVARVIVVTGRHHRAYAEALAPLAPLAPPGPGNELLPPDTSSSSAEKTSQRAEGALSSAAARRPTLLLLRNQDPTRGPFSSIQLGLEAALGAQAGQAPVGAKKKAKAEASLLIQPLDSPVPSAGLLAALLRRIRSASVTAAPRHALGRAWAAGARPTTNETPSQTQALTLAAIPSYEGQRGHPVALSSGFAQSLLALDPGGPQARLDLQLRRAREGGRVAELSVDEADILLNLNTAEDWNTYMRLHS